MQSATTQINGPSAKEAAAMNGEAMTLVPVDEKKESPSADGYIPQEVPMHTVHPMMNGMPPSQVYVNTAMGYHGMTGLEAQFHSMGMSDAHDSSNNEDSEGNDAAGDGSNEDDPIKLFIGQVSISAAAKTFYLVGRVVRLLPAHNMFAPPVMPGNVHRTDNHSNTFYLIDYATSGSESNE